MSRRLVLGGAAVIAAALLWTTRPVAPEPRRPAPAERAADAPGRGRTEPRERASRDASKLGRDETLSGALTSSLAVVDALVPKTYPPTLDELADASASVAAPSLRAQRLNELATAWSRGERAR